MIDSSDILLANVDKLNVSSNEAASSLKKQQQQLKKLQVILEIIPKILQKWQHYQMKLQHQQLMEKLANQTTVAMDEINNQVNLINEAITVLIKLHSKQIF